MGKNSNIAFEKLNYTKNSKKIVSVGRIEKQKNYELIIRALEKTDYELDIYGEGSLKQSLSQLAENVNVKVNFLELLAMKSYT